MRIPRISIAGIMVVIVIIGVDLAAVRMLASDWSHPMEAAVLVSLPMASLLAVLGAGRIGPHGRRPGPFLSGFLAFGATAMIATAAEAVVLRGSLMNYLEAVGAGLNRILHALRSPGLDSIPRTIVEYGVIPGMVFLPQLFVAVLGGWLGGRYRVTITRRRPPGAGAGEGP